MHCLRYVAASARLSSAGFFGSVLGLVSAGRGDGCSVAASLAGGEVAGAGGAAAAGEGASGRSAPAAAATAARANAREAARSGKRMGQHPSEGCRGQTLACEAA